MRRRIIVAALAALVCLATSCQKNVAPKEAETSATGQAPQAVITLSESGGPHKVRKIELTSDTLDWVDVLPVSKGWIWTTHSYGQSPLTTIWGLNGQDPLEKPVKIAEYSLPREESTARVTQDEAGNVRVFFGYAGFRTISCGGGKFSMSDLKEISFDASRGDRFSRPIPISKDQMLSGGKLDEMTILSLGSEERTPLQLSGWPAVITVIRSGAQARGHIFALAAGNQRAKPYAGSKCYVCRATLTGGNLVLDRYCELPASPVVLMDLFSRLYSSGDRVWLSYANVLYSVNDDLTLTEVLASRNVAALQSANGDSVLELFSNAPSIDALRDF